MTLLSWWKDGCPYQTYACSSNTPEAIERMRAEGFIPMAERIAQLIEDNEKADRRVGGDGSTSVITG